MVRFLLIFTFFSLSPIEGRMARVASLFSNSMAFAGASGIETSVSLLMDHIADIRALVDAAAEANLDDIEHQGKNLATKYEFEVLGKIKSRKYREASYFLDKAELDYKKLRQAYIDVKEDKDDGLKEAWKAFQDSRLQILRAKKGWQVQ